MASQLSEEQRIAERGNPQEMQRLADSLKAQEVERQRCSRCKSRRGVGA